MTVSAKTKGPNVLKTGVDAALKIAQVAVLKTCALMII